MYVGTVLNRTVDEYGYDVTNPVVWRNCRWLPPDLSAVHYAMNGSFATQKWFLPDVIRTHSALSKFMTISSMIVEGFCPILCLLFSKSAHLPALLLALLHAGLFATMNLPNWQLLGMAACVTWIPSHVWDRIQTNGTNMLPRRLRVWLTRDYFGKKDDDDNEDDDDDDKPKSKPLTKRHIFSKAVTCFFLGYMVYNWCGERGWIAKHDGGDIGEFVRVSQHWVMYGTLSTRTVNAILTGRLESNTAEQSAASPETSRRVDILGALRLGSWGEMSEMDPAEYSRVRKEIAEDMSAQFPSPRWERALSQWGEKGCHTSAEAMRCPLPHWK